MLRAQELSFHYKKRPPVFEGLSFQVENGEVASIVGPNGAGKSTLLKCINRINAPTAGAVFIDGLDAARLSGKELSRRVGYVPQDTGSGFAISVADAVMLGRTPYIRFWPGRRDKELVFEMIERLGLGQYAFTDLSELSGGERQRVFLARALVQEPQIMLLDEPISSLDVRYQIETLDLIRAVVRDRNILAVMVLHDLSFAYRYSDRVILLKKGMKALEGGRDILSAETIRQVYRVNAEVSGSGPFPFVNPRDVADGGPPL